MDTFLTRLGKTEFERIMAESTCISDFFNKIGKAKSGTAYNAFKAAAKSLDIDISKFENAKPKIDNKKLSREEMFSKGRHRSSHVLRRAMVKEGFDDCFCAVCKISNLWNEKKLTMQIDHIDGDNKNNCIENLRFICPNCHTQTSTYGFKNRGTKKECKCGEFFIGGKKSCPTCRKKRLDLRVWPAKEEVEKLLETNTVAEIAVLLGKSRVTMYKFCAREKIKYKNGKS